MRFFNDYIPGGHKINPALFWDYDIPAGELAAHPALVATKVIKYGGLEDFYAAFDLLDGINKFIQIAKEQVADLDSKELNFICYAFDIKKEDTICYKIMQSRQKHLNSSEN